MARVRNDYGIAKVVQILHWCRFDYGPICLAAEFVVVPNIPITIHLSNFPFYCSNLRIRPSQQFFSHVGTKPTLPGFKQYCRDYE